MKDGLGSLYRITKRDVPCAAEILGRAFAQEDFVTHFYSEEERLPMAESLTSIGCYIGVRYGEVYATSANKEGVAAWFPPGQAPFGLWQTIRSVPLGALIRFGRLGAARMRAMGDYVDELHRKLVPQPHWYLQVIGVDPEQQGKGFSSRLIRPMLERIDAEGLPCYLETQTEKNVSIYERFGFTVLQRDKLPGTDLPVICLLRDNKEEA